ncbi:hypothetical protein TNCV_4776021 [Trichonephila clavipes]|nr:hypothetical protein TNCV_4776021 [Trichonephila clavipes]
MAFDDPNTPAMSDGTFSESSINEIFKTCDVESERVGSSTCRAEIKIPSTKGAERECWEFHNIVLTRGLQFIGTASDLVFRGIWILTDSRASIEHLSRWITVEDMASLNILNLVVRLLDQ